MKRQQIPKELVKAMNENPNVEKATEWTVTFTKEFKFKAYEEYKHGKPMREIFTEAGFDVTKLGGKRIQNFRNKLVSKAEDDSGFADKRKDKSLQTAPSTEAQMMKRIRELEHRNAYLEQENDFLKKIRTLEEECGGKEEKRR
jgi:transposase-like protein